ncbi:hypothetical protein DEO72_LG4g1157 [Vigna unguiculata]|uniref:Uncharacterized protein n=1 Tax=Vigna unguiculata TaxID=3917 RepID=A0A4D6LMZ5_VIGUN|nr:hypothetical protein DEO72_LG4g1157 [Vigna unguiculata]
MVSKLPAETTPDAQTVENAPSAETVENAPKTQTTQPPRNEVESQVAPLPTSEEPSSQFRMKLHIKRMS